jgi:hypothetical protein
MLSFAVGLPMLELILMHHTRRQRVDAQLFDNMIK